MQKTQQKLKAGNAAYETIREMAIEFRFRPDEKINEVELSSALGVSRTPVREALSRLVSENLVSFRRNYGFYCRSLSEPELDDLLDAIALMNRDLANRILASAMCIPLKISASMKPMVTNPISTRLNSAKNSP